jgi:hypothetical protein
MTQFSLDSTCEGCAFWRRLDQEGGSCRRRAPTPGNRPDEIAHWARTHRDDVCGEWRAVSLEMRSTVKCAECIYWRRSAHGSVPVDSLDQFSDWWKHSGHCLRVAPVPSTEPGNRSFWPATHQNDGCAEGIAP